MKDITNFFGALAFFALAIAIAFNPYKESDTANSNLEQISEEEIEANRYNIKLSEAYTVLDIRESVHSNGRINILLVLQDNNKNRAYYGYDSNEIFIKDKANINNNVRIIAPGDKVIYLGNNTFELIVEQ